MQAMQSSDRPLESLDRDGFLILPHVLESRRVTRLVEELEPWLQTTPRCVGDFYGEQTTRVGGLLSKSAVVRDLVMHPEILAIARALLQPACDVMQLNLTQAVRIHPGERAQAPHRDEEMWPNPTDGRHWLVNVMWAVSDFTEENGATRIWPASHRRALDRGEDERDALAAEMSAGSALIFLGSLTHSGGANRSSAARTGVIVSYCLGWLKPYENQFLAYPKEVAQSFPEDLQRLIGYQMHRPNLGGWEGRDPIGYLRGEGVGPHVDDLTPEIAAELKAHYAGDGTA